MGKRIFKSSGWTAAGVADAATMVNQQFMALQGSTSTQMVGVSEVSVSGLGTLGAAIPMQFSRDSTIGVTPTALTTGESDAAMHPATAAIASPVLAFTQASTRPQRSATLGLITTGVNAFGGIYKWSAYQESDYLWLLGNSASFGELSLSAFTGGASGLVMSHITYEPK